MADCVQCVPILGHIVHSEKHGLSYNGEDDNPLSPKSIPNQEKGQFCSTLQASMTSSTEVWQVGLGGVHGWYLTLHLPTFSNFWPLK
jgi:hypothetical protein